MYARPYPERGMSVAITPLWTLPQNCGDSGGARIAGGVSPSQNPMHFCWVGTATRGRAQPSCRFKIGEGAALGILICKFRLRYREG